METIRSTVAAKCVAVYVKVKALREEHANAIMLMLGVMLLSAGMVELSHAAGGGNVRTYSQASYDPTLVRAAVGSLFALVEGSFGALIMVAAGLAAIVAAAMGAYRAAVSLLVVAVSAFILRALVSLFFGSEYDPLEGQVTEGEV